MMKSLCIKVFGLLLAVFACQSCFNQKKHEEPKLPLSGGIQVSIHTTGGDRGLNDTIQISDHWQLSSVGRSHGWVRKLDPIEQRKLVKALQHFSFLSHQESNTEERDGIAIRIVARGSGERMGAADDAEEITELIGKFIDANKRVIASR